MPTVCVVGLGYIGLPTACLIAAAGHKVIGVDIDSNRVACVNSAKPPFDEPGLAELLESVVPTGRLQAFTRPQKADSFILCLPTPVEHASKRPDLTLLIKATAALSDVVSPGNLMVVESTVAPGDTLGVVGPLIAQALGGADFDLCCCPERAIPGQTLGEMVSNDRVIGGCNRQAADRAAAIYSTFVKGQLLLTDVATAEMVKLAENAFRDVNIAYANELALACEHLGLDVWQVIRLANHHPRVSIHRPGPGVGGHCIAVDPWYIAHAFPQARLIPLARNQNDDMVRHVVELVSRQLSGVARPKVAVLGVAYKPDVDDVRESPALRFVEEAQKRGWEVAVHDPLVRRCELPLLPLPRALEQADCAVILTDHHAFAALTPELIGERMRHRRLVDCRGCVDASRWRAVGFDVRVLGVGSEAE